MLTGQIAIENLIWEEYLCGGGWERGSRGGWAVKGTAEELLLSITAPVCLDSVTTSQPPCGSFSDWILHIFSELAAEVLRI